MTTFLQDNFTGAGGTTITNGTYTAGIGSTYTDATAGASFKLLASGTGSRIDNTGFSWVYNNATPPSADYDVLLTVQVNTQLVTWSACGRSSSTVRYEGGYSVTADKWFINAHYSGADHNVQQTNTITSPSAGHTYRCRLHMVGTALSLYVSVDGATEVLVASGTDTSITAAGYAGFTSYENTLTPSDAAAPTFTFLQALTNPAATTYSVGGPTSGLVTFPSTNFSVSFANYITAGTTITPSDGASGIFYPASLTFATNGILPPATQTFVYAPATAGAKTISFTNSSGLTDPSGLAYTPIALPAASNPVGQTFNTTEIAMVNGYSNEPYVCWDPTALVYRMYGSMLYSAWMSTSNSPKGPWGVPVSITLSGGPGGYSKPYLLSNVNGNPIKYSGNYIAYMVHYNSGSSGPFQCVYFTSPSLSSTTWTYGGVVLSWNPSLSATQDGFGGLAWSCIYDGSSTYYLYYVGCPGTNGTGGTFGTTGYASAVCAASSTDATGQSVAFTRLGGQIVASSTSTDWDYGGTGIMRVVVDPTNSSNFIGCYNGTNTRPSSSGSEPDNVAFGWATAPALSGPWTKQTAYNPIVPPNLTNAGSIEYIDVWRPCQFFDAVTGSWLIYYNAGAYGREVITAATTQAVAPVPTFGTYLTDTFTRANSGTVGNGWIDVSSVFSISSNTLYTTGNGLLARPNSESKLNMQVSLTWSSISNVATEAACILRIQNSYSNSYGLDLYNGALQLNTTVNGTTTTVWTIPFTSTVGHSYQLTFGCIGASPTLLYFSITDLTGGGSANVTNWCRYDNTAGLQSIGQAGLYAYSNGHSVTVTSASVGSITSVIIPFFESSMNGNILDIASIGN